jgi:hypothetical protein
LLDQKRVMRQKPVLIVLDETKRTFRFDRGPMVELKRGSRVYDMRIWNSDQFEFLPHSSLRVLEIDEGSVFLDGLPIVNPVFDHCDLSWCQKTKDHFTSAVLHFTTDGLSFTGVLYGGGDERSAVAHHVGGAIPPSNYTSWVSQKGFEGASEESEWDKGPVLTMGYEFVPGHELPQRIVKINDEDLKTEVLVSVNEKGNLVLEKDCNDPDSDASCAGNLPTWPASGKIEFSWDAKTFQGSMKKFDFAEMAPSKLQFNWKGEVQAALAPKRAIMRSPVPLLVNADELSVAELYTISPEGVQERLFDMLIENMKWAMDPDWRENFFGEQRPIISPDREDLINRDLSFYKDKFSKAYLGWGIGNISGTGAPRHPLTDAERLNLKYYLYTGIAKEEGYNMQSEGLFLQAFILRSPRLQEYIRSDRDGWADRLYKEITTPEQINITMLGLTAEDPVPSRNKISRLSNILSALQPSGVLAQSYHNIFCIRSFLEITKSATHEDEATIGEWLPDLIKKFIDEYAGKPVDPTIKEQAIKIEMANCLQKAVQTSGGITNLAKQMTDAFISAPDKRSSELHIKSACEGFAKKFPKLAKAARFFRFAFWAGGLFVAVQGFMDWKNLSKEKKASLFLTVFQVVDKMLTSVPEMLSIANLTKSVLDKIKNFCGDHEILKGIERGIQSIEESWLGRLAQRVRSFFNTVKKEIEVGESVLGKAFRLLSKILKWLGVLVSAAFAALSTWQFIKDIKNHASTAQKAFDGIIMSCDILTSICFVISAFVVTTIFAILAAVLAVIGAVFSIVEMFLPKPRSPVDVFVDGVLHPFIATLPAAPAGWDPTKPNPS